jgi:hypothetical protein
MGLPLQGAFGMPFDIVARLKSNAPASRGAQYYSASWSFFDALKIPLLRGCTFTDHDDASSPRVMIVDVFFA